MTSHDVNGIASGHLCLYANSLASQEVRFLLFLSQIFLLLFPNLGLPDITLTGAYYIRKLYLQLIVSCKLFQGLYLLQESVPWLRIFLVLREKHAVIHDINRRVREIMTWRFKQGKFRERLWVRSVWKWSSCHPFSGLSSEFLISEWIFPLKN